MLYAMLGPVAASVAGYYKIKPAEKRERAALALSVRQELANDEPGRFRKFFQNEIVDCHLQAVRSICFLAFAVPREAPGSRKSKSSAWPWPQRRDPRQTASAG